MQNPWKDHPRSINPPQRAGYPAEFKKLFEGPDAPRGGFMWIPPREPVLLDYKDALFILIGRSPNLGLPLCPPPSLLRAPMQRLGGMDAPCQGSMLELGCSQNERPTLSSCAEHPRKRLPQSLEELLDEAVKSDVSRVAFDETTDDDSAMIDKLRSDVAADRYGIQPFHQLSDCPWQPIMS